VGRGRGPRRCARLRGRAPGEDGAVLVVNQIGTSRRASRRWGCSASTPVRRPGGERPGRGLSGVRHRRRTWAGRPGAVPASPVDRRPRAPASGRHSRPGGVCD
jgi:hypothetical protein